MFVGFFVFIGLVCMAYLTVTLGNLDFLNNNGYTLTANFRHVTGLKKGASVEIAGVAVGKVTSMTLNTSTDPYSVDITMYISASIPIYEQASAAIKTNGLLGDQYVDLYAGNTALEQLENNDEVEDTTPPVDLTELISKYAFGDVTK